MQKATSLATRALLAVLLTIGFYGLALAIVAALLFVVYAEFEYAHRINLRLTAFCLIGAGTILWSILPRPDRFTAPGPQLQAVQHPRLFETISDIARRVNQKMPAEIYLVPDVNAFVAERGGLMGIGSRRVMGIGLPLLQTFTVPQLRAVIAHEFGHFYGGDTKLGPWVYKTRGAIGRTIQGLGRSWLQAPFRWYGLLFLRITHAVSRRQEFVADQLAVQTVGSRHLVNGLRAIHSVAPAYDAFWRNEYAPMLEAGYRASLVEGFAQFIREPSIVQAMQKTVEQELESSQTDPYDTHPSLKERIMAAEALAPGPDGDDGMSALDLLTNVAELERDLFVRIFGEQKVKSLNMLDWHQVGAQVWLPHWEKTAGKYADSIKGVTPASLPTFLRSPEPLAKQLQASAQQPLALADVGRGVVGITAMALCVTLVRRGWQLDSLPGAPVSVSHAGHVFRPFDEIGELASGSSLAEETWQQRCAQAGIANLDLGNLS